MSDNQHNQDDQDYDQEQGYQPQQSHKQALIRLSDMQPQDESNASMEEVADIAGIPQAQKYSKIAGILKRELDNRLGQGYYVICGKNFGTFVTHQQGSFIHFSFDDLHFCCFRAN